MTNQDELELRNELNNGLKNHKNNNFQEAKKIYEKILIKNPKHFETNFYLGTLLAQNKVFKDSLFYLKKASEINFNLPDLHNNLGLIYRELGELENALNSISKAIELKPDYANAYSNLGLICKELGQLIKAEKYCKKSIRLNPRLIDPYNNLGLIYLDKQNYIEAKKYLKKALELNPKYSPALLNLGNLEKNFGEIEKAENIFKEIISINPNYFDAYNNLMDLYEGTNQNEKLLEIISHSKNIFKENLIVKLFYGQYLYKTKKYDKAINTLKNINFNNQLNRERLRCLVIAKSYDQLDKTTQSFKYFKITNEINLTTKSKEINKSKTIDTIEKRKKFFNKPIKFNLNKSKKKPAENLVFLIGFPRSGTTLLDTILRSHSSIEVIEEENLIGDLVNSINKSIVQDFKNLDNIKDADIDNLRNSYLASRNKFIKNKNTKIIIDKMPLNIIHVGEIIKIFPNAKFLVSLRHPCDCVLSSYMQSFKMNNAMANFLDLEDSARLYDHVMSLWFQYKDNLQINYIEIKYESIVSEFRNTINNVLSFLNISWSDDVLNFYTTAQKRDLISTPSYDQVNQPIYSKSVYKWKKYEGQIEKVIPILKPWINRLEY